MTQDNEWEVFDEEGRSIGVRGDKGQPGWYALDRGEGWTQSDEDALQSLVAAVKGPPDARTLWAGLVNGLMKKMTPAQQRELHDRAVDILCGVSQTEPAGRKE